MTASRACNYLQNAAATTYKKFLQFYAKRSCKKQVSQQTISKYEKVDENISGDMLLALSKFFKVPVDYILRKDEEEQQREQDNKREIMELYRDMDQYNRDTWIIIGKRLLGGQLHKYNEDSIVEKRLKE